MATPMSRALASQGQKIWFPNIQLTLLKYDGPANIACFRVPLNVNKLDIKNYLRSIYQIDALQINTRIYQQPAAVRANGGTSKEAGPLSKTHKKAYVTLKEPFVWPEPDPRWKEYLSKPEENEKRQKSRQARDLYLRNMRTHTQSTDFLKRVSAPKAFSR